MLPRRVLLGGAGTLAALTLGVAPAVAAPINPEGCSFHRGTTTCVTTQSATLTFESGDGVSGRRVSEGGVTAWGDACLAFQPATWYYGAYGDTTLEVTTTTTTTTTYRGRARHDRKIASTSTVSSAYDLTEGAIFCYTTNSPNPVIIDAPYPP